MNPDEAAGREACLEARRLFSRALEDPEAEKAILRHASACLECMDAWLELQDTVKKLEAAASEIPETGGFSTRVLDAIERETHARRRRFRLTLAAGAGFLGGLGVAFVALNLLLGAGNGSENGHTEPTPGDEIPWETGPAGPETQETGDPAKNDPDPDSVENDAERSGVGEKEDTTGDENEQKPIPEKVQELFETVREMEREAMEGPRHGRGRRGSRFRDIVTAASALDSGDLALLIDKLKKDEFYPVFGPRNRMREELIARLEALQDKRFRRGDGG